MTDTPRDGGPAQPGATGDTANVPPPTGLRASVPAVTSDPTTDRHREAREGLVAYLRDTIEDTALLIEDHRDGKETDKRWGWFADGILAALSPVGPEEPREGLRTRLLELLGPSHPHDEGRDCGTCAAYNLLATTPIPDTGAEERLRAALREAIKADLTALAHWSTEDWQERGRGADPIARTINAARDIVDARFDEHDRG